MIRGQVPHLGFHQMYAGQITMILLFSYVIPPSHVWSQDVGLWLPFTYPEKNLILADGNDSMLERICTSKLMEWSGRWFHSNCWRGQKTYAKTQNVQYSSPLRSTSEIMTRRWPPELWMCNEWKSYLAKSFSAMIPYAPNPLSSYKKKKTRNLSWCCIRTVRQHPFEVSWIALLKNSILCKQDLISLGLFWPYCALWIVLCDCNHACAQR